MRVPRYLKQVIAEVLKKKMVFLGGPRQVGKTSFALDLLAKNATEKHPAYMNWDSPLMKKNIQNAVLAPDQALIILDEVHKYPKWRNLVKGLYDTEKSERKFLITGSARLDYYRKGGDSLVNRYRYFRMHPLSINEISKNPTQLMLDRLLNQGGFPEPYLAEDSSDLRFWQRDRLSRVIREDLRDLENVRDITKIELMVELLQEKVGSLLSVNSVREDVEVDFKTAERWLQILENLYVCFRISPYGSPKIRALKKERKLYLWDWSVIENRGARFENLVASQLLKYCHFIEDTQAHKMELQFIRDVDKRELDFIVLKNKKIEFAVECKSGGSSINPAIHYFRERVDIPQIYQVHLEKKHFSTANVEVIPFIQFCQKLGLP